MWLPRITARCPIAVQEDVFSTQESPEVCSFVAIALEIQYWLHCRLCLCCNIRNSSLLGHTAQDFGEEIGSSVIKYYFALGKINKWASSAAYFVTVLRTVLHFSDKQTVTYFQPRFWVVLCFAVGFVWFLFFSFPFRVVILFLQKISGWLCHLVFFILSNWHGKAETVAINQVTKAEVQNTNIYRLS